MRVDVGGTQINYEISGQGPVLVLTHGLGGSLDAWQPLADALGTRHRVFRRNVCGFGQSDRSGRLSPQIWAQDLAGLLDALSIDEAVVAGISMGGVNVQRFALDFPERTRGLVLMSTSSEVEEAGRSGWESRPDRAERRSFDFVLNGLRGVARRENHGGGQDDGRAMTQPAARRPVSL